MDGLLLQRGTANQRAAPGTDRMVGCVSDKIRCGFGRRGNAVLVAFAFVDQGIFGIAESTSGLDNGVEDRLQLESGPIDDIENVAGRFLPLQRLFQLGPESCSGFFPIGSYNWSTFVCRRSLAPACRLARRLSAPR